jgi:hypothetical protein
MAKLTPEELQARKRQKAEEERLEGERREQAEAEQAEAEERERRELAERRNRLAALNSRHDQLASVVSGLYDEVHKLTLKWPTMEATPFLVDKTNQSVTAVRQLIGESMKDALGHEDEFAEGIEPIITAGDQPEYRDMLLRLRELKQALERAQQRLGGEADKIATAEHKLRKKDDESTNAIDRMRSNSRW